MKKWSARLLALTLCFALVLGQGSIVSATESVGDTPEVTSEVVEETTEDVVEDEVVSEEVSEELSSEEVSEEISEEEESEEVSEEISEEEVSEEVSEEISEEEESEEVSEEISEEEVSEEVSEEISEEEQSEEESEEASEEEADYAEMFPGLSTMSMVSDANLAQKENMVDNIIFIHELKEGIDCVSNEILVTVESEELALEYAKAFNGTLKKFDTNFAVITLNADPELPQATVAQAVLASVNADCNLPVAWPNYYRQLMDEPAAEDTTEEFFQEYIEEIDEANVGASTIGYDDPFLKADSSYYQWFHSLIGSAYAWEAGYTGSGVKVGVIDTGIRTGHQDITATSTYNAVTGQSGNADDYDGHGTHVSSIIASKANNSVGGVGVAPGAQIYFYKADASTAANDNKGLSDDAIVSAINRAVTDNVDILNMSLGAPYPSDVEGEAILRAYNSGMAVFVSAGNDDTNTPFYPAADKGAICIAALDKDAQKSSFSAYGSHVRYAAPGVDIWAAYAGTEDASGRLTPTTNAYASLDGTSMASPAMAGTAAVMLQWARANGKITEKNTGKDVDALLKLMDKGAVKAKGSGLGKGYVNLPKAMGLSDALKAPSAPTVTVKAGTYEAETLSIGFNAIKGCTIYYATDGKTPALKNGQITNGTAYTGAFTIGNAKAVTVKAIAVRNDTKLVSKVLTAKYTFKPKVRTITLSAEGGTAKVAKGAKLNLKASVVPAFAANSKVTWEVEGKPAGITISSSGALTVKATATVSSCVVRATAKDGSEKYGRITVTIVENANPTNSIKASKTSVTLLNSKTVDLDITVTYKDKTTADATKVSWASQDTNVATVSVTGGKLRITGKTAGKTKIIGRAADGTAKTVTITVTVNQAVGSIAMSNVTLAAGKSLKLTPTIAPSNAKNKSLDWKISPEGQGVTVKNGKASATSKAVTGNYTVTATAKDGSGVAKAITLTVTEGKMSSLKFSQTKATIYRVAGNFKSKTSMSIPLTIAGANTTSWDVKSSHPGIVTVAKNGSSAVTVSATGMATGTATITVTSTDGSNLKSTCKVTVENPASALRLSVPSGRCVYVANGKTMNLVSTFEQEFGKIGSSVKNLTWSSSNTNVMTVTQKGVVKSLRSDGSACTITATSPDGTKASIMLAAVGKITSIEVDQPLWGNAWLADVGYVYDLGLTVYGDGVHSSGQFTYTVSGGNGVTITYQQGMFLMCANKKGTYKITIKSKEGCGKSTSVTYIVK